MIISLNLEYSALKLESFTLKLLHVPLFIHSLHFHLHPFPPFIPHHKACIQSKTSKYSNRAFMEKASLHGQKFGTVWPVPLGTTVPHQNSLVSLVTSCTWWVISWCLPFLRHSSHFMRLLPHNQLIAYQLP